MLRAGGNFAPETLNGAWWRLLSSGFVHIGIVHLFFNMYVLYSTGCLVEQFFGHILYAGVYTGAMLGGSLLSIAVHQNVVSAGASGALFGLFGAILAFMLRCRESVPAKIRKNLVQNASVCIGYNLLYGVQAGIDNWCHLGGAIAGFACGYIAAIPLRQPDRESQVLKRFLVLAAFIAAFSISAYTYLQRSQHSGFYTALKQCVAIDESFMENHPDVHFDMEGLSREEAVQHLDLLLKELVSPKLEILQAVPQKDIPANAQKEYSLYMELNETQRDALSLHRKAILTQDASLTPEIQRLYEKAFTLESFLGVE